MYLLYQIGLNFVIAAAGLITGWVIVNNAADERMGLTNRAGNLTATQDAVEAKLPALRVNNANQCAFLASVASTQLIERGALAGLDEDDVRKLIADVENTLDDILDAAKANTC